MEQEFELKNESECAGQINGKEWRGNIWRWHGNREKHCFLETMKMLVCKLGVCVCVSV